MKRIFIILLLINLCGLASAQINFLAPDTVCVDQQVDITNYWGGILPSDTGKTPNKHQWFYESATISGRPTTQQVKMGAYPINGGLFLNSVRDNDQYFLFVSGVKKAGPLEYQNRLYRSSLGNRVTNPAFSEVEIPLGAAIQNITALEGIDIIKSKDDNIYYGIMVGTNYGSDKFNKIIRAKFVNGIDDPAPVVDTLSVPPMLFRFPHELQLIDDNGHYYCFVANETDTSISWVDFPPSAGGLNCPPDSVKYGKCTYPYKPNSGDPATFGGALGLSGFSSVYDKGVWHILASTHQEPVKLVRFDFNNGLGKTPLVTTFSKPGTNATNSMSHTEDLAFVRDCNYQMAISVSDHSNNEYHDGTSLSIITFDSSGVTGTDLTAKRYASLGFSGAHNISDIYNEGSFIYAFIGGSNDVTLIKFSPDTGNKTTPLNPADTFFVPSPFSYNNPGRHNISLVVGNDASKTTCRTVIVVPPIQPPVKVDSAWICYGQDLRGFPASGTNPNKITYDWMFPGNSDYNIKGGRRQLATISGYYVLRNSHGACVSDTIKRYIRVDPRPAPPGAQNVESCPEKALTTSLMANKIVKNDTIIWYSDAQLKNKVYSEVSTGIISTFIPKDSVIGNHTYYVVRYPSNDEVCLIKSSDSVKVILTIRHPNAPYLGKDTAFCLGKIPNLVLVKPGVNWYNDPSLDTILATGYTWKPSYFPKGGVYTIYANYDSLGCRSLPGDRDLTVIETPVPDGDSIVYGCENFTVPNKFYVTKTVAGAVLNYYDSLQKPKVPDDPSLTAKTKGIYRYFVRQTANNCPSVYKPLQLVIYKAEPPIPVMQGSDFYACLLDGGLDSRIKVTPDPNYTKIEWTDKNLFPIGEGEELSPVADPGDTMKIYKVSQTIRYNSSTTCKSLPVTINLHIVSCTEVPVSRCNTDSSLALFSTIPVISHSKYKWQDNDFTEALKDSAVDLRNPTLFGNTSTFQYYTYLVKVNVEKQLYSGLPQSTSTTSCDSKFNADVILSERDNGGKWTLNDIKFTDPTNVTLSGGTNVIKYSIPKKGACIADQSVIVVAADSTEPIITCPKSVFHSIEVGEGGYYAVGTELDPILTEDSCSYNTLVTNDHNQKSSLDSAFFSIHEKSIETHVITWTARDSFNRSATCSSELTISTFKIPNLITPNGDGENDEWMFGMEKNPDAIVFVYNRSGQQVFKSNGGREIKWDGTLNGIQLPPDGYSYIIKEGSKIIYKGTVTIMH